MIFRSIYSQSVSQSVFPVTLDPLTNLTNLTNCLVAGFLGLPHSISQSGQSGHVAATGSTRAHARRKSIRKTGQHTVADLRNDLVIGRATNLHNATARRCGQRLWGLFRDALFFRHTVSIPQHRGKPQVPNTTSPCQETKTKFPVGSPDARPRTGVRPAPSAAYATNPNRKFKKG